MAQYKVNDSRLVLIINSVDDIQLWNRHGSKMVYTPPGELINQLKELASITGPCILDGGLLDSKHKAIKDTIALWDILNHNGTPLRGTTYMERQKMLHTMLLGDELTIFSQSDKSKRIIGSCHVGYNFKDPVYADVDKTVQLSGGIFLMTNYRNNWDNMWEKLTETNAPYTNIESRKYSSGGTITKQHITPLIEGLVFKDPTGKLTNGLSENNNASWQAKSRVETNRHKF
jgi:hypothetical protein